jgi:beta-lactamase class C
MQFRWSILVSATLLAGVQAVAAAASAAPASASAASLAELSQPAAEAERVAEIVAQFDANAETLVAGGRLVGLATVVVHRGEVVSARGHGVTDVTTGHPVETTTAFRLASLSKGFAATLAALLVDDGFLSWDSTVQELVPSFQLADTRQSGLVTLRDLMSHRVGLAYNSLDPLLERNEPYPMLVYKLRELPMRCGVGDCFGYQNIAFSLVGDMAFATTGDFYSYEVERRIFHPLGMTGATFGRDALEASASWARPHVRGGRGWEVRRPKETYYRVMPAAGVNASIEDIGKWLNAQLGHAPDVLSPELLELLHTPVVATPGETTRVPWRRERVLDAQYALGFRVYDYAGHRMVFHGGAVQGYRAMLALLPEHDLGVALLWNSESPYPSGLLPDLLDAYLGLPARDWAGVAPRARGLARRN